MTLEYCCHCENPTGRAGRGEDSIYAGDTGPFCPECRDNFGEILGEIIDSQSRKIAELGPLARIGASVMPRPISEANIETGSFIAFVDVTNNKTGENWTEKHLVWIDEDTGEIAIDCEQGWRLEDYHSFVPLSALPKPQVTP